MSMTKPILVTIEHSPKKTFATAADWPGWSRSGKNEQLALDALVAYGPRYAAHRIAWHALDHAWEIEDRSEPAD